MEDHRSRPLPGWVLVLCLWAGLSHAEERRPNIVLFLMDDMGIGDTRVYDPHCTLDLPHIEGLAEWGMVFTDAHAPAAVCAPTRYSILTGNYPWRGREPNGTWAAHRPSQIRPGQKTLGDLLHRVGYDTMFVGKEHLGGGLIAAATGTAVRAWQYSHRDIDFSRAMPEGLHTKGFDHVFSLPSGIQGKPYAFFENGRVVGGGAGLREWKQGVYGSSEIKANGYGVSDWDSSEAGPILTARAVAFLDQHFATTPDRPFFLLYSSQSCHTPHTPPAELAGVAIRGATAGPPHHDMIFEADVTLGLIMDRIREAGALPDTLLIFTSDNGGLQWSQREEGSTAHNSNASLKGGKGQIWEGGHRVPLIVAWGEGSASSHVAAGSSSTQLIGLQDLYLTLAELTGQSVAADEGLDSHSFLPALLGGGVGPGREELLIQSNNESSWGQDSARCFRVGPWKLVITKDDRPRHLYCLADDPGERRDRIDEPEQAERVAAMLTAYHRTITSRRSTALPEAGF